MFDLENEVAAWSRSMNAERCRREGGVAELIDHLNCEIDRARAGGLSEEQAFHAAVARLDGSGELRAEIAKNRSWLGRACAAAARFDRADSSGAQRRFLLAHSLVWAGLFMAVSLVIVKHTTDRLSGWMLTGVLLPLWWGSQELLRAALRERRGDGRR